MKVKRLKYAKVRDNMSLNATLYAELMSHQPSHASLNKHYARTLIRQTNILKRGKEESELPNSFIALYQWYNN